VHTRFLQTQTEVNKIVVRNLAADADAGDFCLITSGDDKIQRVLSVMGWLGDVLNVPKRLEQLMKTNSVGVIRLVNVNVYISTDDH